MRFFLTPIALMAAIVGLQPDFASASHQRTGYRRAILDCRPQYRPAFQTPAYAPSYASPEYGLPSYGYPPQGPAPGYVEAAVRDLYVTYLGREPDPLGHMSWVNHIYSGAPLIDAQIGILSSPECFARNGSNPETYTRFIFRQALGRECTPEELQNWTALFDQRYYGDRAAFCRDLLLSGNPY